MQHLFFTSLTFLALSTLNAQPVYMLFNANCMQQLEYQHTRSGESVFAYSYQPNPDEHYLFMSASSGMPTPDLPAGTYDCNTLSVTDEAIKIINEQVGSRQMYVLVQQRSGTGYLMMPIYSAVQVKRYDSWFLMVGPNYSFAIDTADLNYQKNLQVETSPTVVRFRGSELANCRYKYTFRGEPLRGNTGSVEFDFIYGIGIVKNSTGANTAEMEESEIRLNSVNGQPYDTYLASICQQAAQQYNTDYNTPSWTNPAQYNSTDYDNNNYYNNYNEPSKEDQPANNGWQQPSNTGLADCPIAPGAGYHVVQPRESLKAIARTYKVDLKSIIKWNNISNPDHIEICQQIWLQKPPAKTASKSSDAPAQYNYTAPGGPTVPNQAAYWGNAQSKSPAQYSSYQNQSFTQTGTHVVQKNETVFGIAKRYACAEECIRRANNFPLEGNVLIKTGQTIIIPECTCQTSGSASPQGYNYRSVSNIPPQIANVMNKKTQPQQPDSPRIYYENPNKRFVEIPNDNNNPDPRNPQPNNDAQDLPPTKEYIVRQGETLVAIAAKHKMSLAELAATNGLDPINDKVPAGRRLVVRQY